MAEYKSNYTGQQIDTAIGKANTALQTETDPIFSASASAGITSQDITNWNAKSDFSGSYNDLTDKPTIPDVSNFITKDVNDLTYYELKTAVGNSIVMSIDSSTYVLTVSLKNSAGTILNTQTVDLPLETMVVSGSYDSVNKKIILTLKNGQTIEFSVADLVSGLQSEITSNNKLSADLVDDTNTTNKFVSASDKTAWNSKYDKPIAGIPKTDLTDAVQTSLGKADTAIQSSDLSTVATSGDYDDLTNKPIIPTVPTNVSAFTNDAGYLTSHQDISGKQDVIQYSTMPTASADTVGKIVQYTGTTDSTYTNGYFYIGATDGEQEPSYSWLQINVQPSVDTSTFEQTANKVTSVSSSSTNTQYPSAKCLYDNIKELAKIVPPPDNFIEFRTAKRGVYLFNQYLQYDGSTTWWGGNVFVVYLFKTWSEALYADVLMGYAFYKKTTGEIGYARITRKNTAKYINIVTEADDNYSFGYTILPNKAQTFSGVKTFSDFPITPSSAPTTDYEVANKKYVDDLLTTYSGYDATKTQVLKNINGTFTWVDEA